MEKRINIQVVSIGAGGNGASIAAIEKNVISKDDVLLINSTNRDIPLDYQENAYIYDTLGGAGKQYIEGERLINHEIEKPNGLSDRLNEFIKEDTDLVVVIYTSEGGTGAGGGDTLAKYINEEIGVATTILLISGFQEDPQGLDNTISVFKNLPEGVSINVVSNIKGLTVKQDHAEAQEIINNDIATKISVLMTNGIVDGDTQFVIDETDLYNTEAFPGYTFIEKVELPKLASKDQFNQAMREMIINSKSIDFEKDKKTAKRAVFINLKDESEAQFIDYEFPVLVEYFGSLHEVYKHVQYQKNQPSYVSLINSGMSLPLTFVSEIQELKKKKLAEVVTKDNNFSQKVAEMETQTEPNFNVTRRRRRNTSNTSGKDFVIENAKKKAEEEQQKRIVEDDISKNY